MGTINTGGIYGDAIADVSKQAFLMTTKSSAIQGAYSVITTAALKALWIFDATGTTQTIVDRSSVTSLHTATLRNAAEAAINASTCSPGFSGASPYLTMDATHIWDTPDIADMSFAGPAAFSVFWVGSLTAFTTVRYLIAKCAATQYEWALFTDAAAKINFLNYGALDGSIYIGRLYNTALTADGLFHSFVATCTTGTTNAAVVIYMDGVAVDNTDNGSGVFVTSVDGTSLVGDYFNTAGTPSLIGSHRVAVAGVCTGALSATQVKQLDYNLRGYTGMTI